MLVVLVICLIGLVAGSSFGIFFSGEDNGTGQTIRTAIAQINQEYQDRLEEIKDSHTFDTLEISGARQFGKKCWPFMRSRPPPIQKAKRWPPWITKS